jgi:DNA modification methylase
MASKRKLAPKPVPALQVDAGEWPANAVERWPIERLKPHPRNARKHSAAQIEQLCASVAEHGVTRPIVVDEDGTVLAGHGLRLALVRFGVAEVPVIVARGWSDARKRAFLLRDNKIADNAGWDKELLGLELAELGELPDVNLSDIGFSVAELDRLIPKLEREGLTDPNAAPTQAAPADVVSRLGDLWLLGEHRLLCGDCTQADHVAAVLGGERPILMVTDPPYGVEYDPDWRNDAEQAGRGMRGAPSSRAVGTVRNDERADWRDAWLLFPGDVAYVWHGALHSSVVEASLASVGLEPRAQLIWAKERQVISRGDYHWQHEPCWYVVRKGATGNWHGDRSQTTLWQIAHRKSDTGHGTQKPIECMKRPIVNNSEPGDFIYDPFCGSGTAIVAAEMTGRRCLAIEIDPIYVDVAVRRWEAFTGKQALLAAGELSMDEAAARPAIAQGNGPRRAGLMHRLLRT